MAHSFHPAGWRVVGTAKIVDVARVARRGVVRATLFALVLVVSCSTHGDRLPSAGPSGAGVSPSRSTLGHSVVREPVVRRHVLLGYSVRHRPIVGYEVGDSDSARRLLVVGCIHGSERAGTAIADALIRSTPTQDVDLWVVPTLNPDGAAAHTRVNGRGVDLNRNFPYQWRRIGMPGALTYSGPGPLSEPESRLALALLKRLRPSLGLWYHQAL